MIAWIDGSAGASGDMLLGALVGAGVPLEALRDPIHDLAIGLTLTQRTVERGGLAATKVDVVTAAGEPADATPADHGHHHRGLSEIVGMLDRLDAPIRDRAVSVFERLARAEAAVHGVTVEEIQFHEVGALDAMADVVGVVAGFDHLVCERALQRVVASTLSLGSGRTRSAHGPIPVPAPAVLALLAKVAPVTAGPAPFESTTPTGAALLAELVDEWAELPAMRIGSVGLGAGGRDADELVNAVRLVLGTSAG
ncbi:MAG: LarC family nickel insertion protein [Actinomycetota bacterium]